MKHGSEVPPMLSKGTAVGSKVAAADIGSLAALLKVP